MSDSGSDLHYSHAVNTATEAIKSLLLVNGGAATALIALKSSSGSNFALLVLFFGLGALLNALTFILGYFSQLNYANGRAACEATHLARFMKLHGQFQIAAIAVLVLSLTSSTIGMFLAFMAI